MLYHPQKNMGRFSIWSSIFRYEERVPLSDELWRKAALKSDKIFQKSKIKICKKSANLNEILGFLIKISKFLENFGKFLQKKSFWNTDLSRSVFRSVFPFFQRAKSPPKQCYIILKKIWGDSPYGLVFLGTKNGYPYRMNFGEKWL
jgi:hypothetical protein